MAPTPGMSPFWWWAIPLGASCLASLAALLPLFTSTVHFYLTHSTHSSPHHTLTHLLSVCCRATTHTDLELRARQRGIPVRVVHNASIMNAVGAAGLQLYRYGEAVSIVFFTETWRPDSFYDKIASNRRIGLHTLCLLGE